jgi:predicted esterase
MGRPIRVLCLHGWRTSGSILQRQTSALRQAFGPKAELVYVDAPWDASGPAPELVRSFYGKSGPFYQWWDAVKREENSEAFRYEGFEHSLDYLVGQVQAQGPVDALLGFSQGAAAATLLTAFYLSNYDHVPWKACVLVGGFYPRNAETQQLLDSAKTSVDGAIDVSSVHVVGRTDPLAPKSEKLFRCFTSSKRVKFEHDEGHKFPSPLKYRQMYHDIAQEVLAMTGQAWA